MQILELYDSLYNYNKHFGGLHILMCSEPCSGGGALQRVSRKKVFSSICPVFILDSV